MRQYKNMVRHIMDHGTLKENRTGTDTLGVFGYFYKHALRNGFPLLTTKKIRWDHIVLENLWFLSGDTNINFLKEYGIKFWDPWADEHNEVPSAYGHFWRGFSGNDQIAFAVNELRKNPLSRRIVISAWDPSHAQNSSLPPCHLAWVLNTQKDAEGDLCLNLALLQRSCDVALGVPYNLAGYAFLLELMAHLTGLKVGEFAHTLVDAHIYVNHLEGLSEQMRREAFPLPALNIDSSIKELKDIEDIIAAKPPIDQIIDIFKLHNYSAHPPITFKVAV